jgi:hypothetical protein
MTHPAMYDPAMVADLPELSQRFFNFAIRPGTPLLTLAEIDMGGEFSLSRDKPNYQPMVGRFWLRRQVSSGSSICPGRVGVRL